MQTKTRLLISSGGEIACAEHAPFAGSDSWWTGAWRPMRVAERAEFQAEIGHPPACETCAAIARQAVRA